MAEGTGLAEPGRIVVAGDWHGNAAWARHVLEEAGAALAAEDVRYVLQLGDFGFWQGIAGQYYLTSVASACQDHGITLLAVRGNHENPAVARIYDIREQRPEDVVIGWLPDGYRWTWHGRRWIAVGGAVSPDRAWRQEGVSWWPEEELPHAEMHRIAGEGTADVLVSHDVGSDVTLSLPPWPRGWAYEDLTRGERYRHRMQLLCEKLLARYWMHGHYHRAYERECDFGYGPVRVTGLDMDGTPGNWAVLDVRTMEWEGR